VKIFAEHQVQLPHENEFRCIVRRVPEPLFIQSQMLQVIKVMLRKAEPDFPGITLSRRATGASFAIGQ
jgi:hypothetical protein